MTTKTVKVQNISCGHCVATIQREVSALEGVASVNADPKTKHVTVAWDPASTSWNAIEGLLKEINYAPLD
ncbi:MAG: heavy-metal-associated domain-containing protein [Gemmatimonadetes bacterium]|nr:heavy-metal-associated domain-containing protein [Gemmatimonadota bacterium]